MQKKSAAPKTPFASSAAARLRGNLPAVKVKGFFVFPNKKTPAGLFRTSVLCVEPTCTYVHCRYCSGKVYSGLFEAKDVPLSGVR